VFTLNFVTKFLHVSVSVDRLQVKGPTYIKTTLLSSFDTRRSTWTKMCCKIVKKIHNIHNKHASCDRRHPSFKLLQSANVV
jgi:hypothetical protein